MQPERKEMVRQYMETPKAMGVFCIRNIQNGKSFLGSSNNLPAMINRQRFQLDAGSHPNKALQREWEEYGSDTFAFEVLDTLEPSDRPDYDPQEDLAALLDMWMDKIAPYGENGYCKTPFRNEWRPQ
jgi:hypothetical protein